MSDWLFRNRQTGELTIAQPPNIPMVIFLVAVLLRFVLDPSGNFGAVVTIAAYGGLVWWAGDEIVRGVNPFRRMLGAVVLLGVVLSRVL